MRILLLFFFTAIMLQTKAQTSDWNGLKKYIGTYSKSTDFFKNQIIKTELKKILGNDYKDYQDFFHYTGCSEIEFKNGLMYGDVSQLHVGGYSSLFFVDIKEKKMYLFWLTSTVGDKQYKIYGGKPTPTNVLGLIEEVMNSVWGHVAEFKVNGDGIDIQLKEELTMGVTSEDLSGQSLKDYYIPSQLNYNKASFYTPSPKTGERTDITRVIFYVKNDDGTYDITDAHSFQGQRTAITKQTVQFSATDVKMIKSVSTSMFETNKKQSYSPPRVLLKIPTSGQTVTWTIAGDAGDKPTIFTSSWTTVPVDGVSEKAIKVISQYTGWKSKTVSYFVERIGLYKTEIIGEDGKKTLFENFDGLSMDEKKPVGTDGSTKESGTGINLTGWTWNAKPNVDDNSDETGVVKFKIKVDSDGDIVDVTLIESTVSPAVAQQYKRAILKTKFRPTSNGDKPEISTGTVTFRLNYK